MSIAFSCPHCGTKLAVPDHLAGRQVKCARCAAILAASATTLPSKPPGQAWPAAHAPARTITSERPPGSRLPWALVAGVGLFLLAAAGGAAVWLLFGRGQPVEPAIVTGDEGNDARPQNADQPAPKNQAGDDLAAEREGAANNLRQIVVAFRNFSDVNNRLPPAVVFSPQGKPLYSWRVLLLPFLDQEALYKEFKLAEPWDSPHNRKLITRMPAVYAPARGKAAEPGATFYQVFVGPDAAFTGVPLQLQPQFPGMPFNPFQLGRRADELTRGLANTILVAEGDKAVPWTKPEDLPFAAAKPLPKLGGCFPDGFHAGFGDGKVYFIPSDVDEKLIRGVVARDGKVTRDDLLVKLMRKGEEPLARGKPVGHWVERLRDKDAAARREAAQALAELVADAHNVKEAGPQVKAATDALARALGDRDPQLRRNVLMALERLGPAVKSAAPAVLASLRGTDGSGWQEVAQALIQMGPEVVPSLVKGLADPDYEVRTTAAYVLVRLVPWQQGKPGGPGARPLEERQRRLLAAFDVHANSPEAPEAVVTLLEALHEKGENEGGGHFCRQAAAALGRIGPMGRVAIPRLIELVRQGDPHQVSSARGPAVAALVGLISQTHQGSPTLADALLVLEPGPVESLADVGPAAVPYLVTVLRADNGPRLEAARVLAEIGAAAKAAVPALRAALHDNDPGLRRQAATALAKIGREARAALPDLIGMLKADDESSRCDAVEALLQLDPGKRETALAVLTDCLGSTNPALAVEAARIVANHDPTNEAALRVLLRIYIGQGMERQQAAQALSDLSPTARQTLRTLAAPLLRALEARKRWDVALVLAPADPEGTLPILIQALKEGTRYDQNTVAKVLERLGPKAKPAFAELRKAFEQAKTERGSWNSSDGNIAQALARINPEAAAPLLLKAWRNRGAAGAKDDPFQAFGWSHEKQDVYQALMDLGPRAAAAIPELLKDLKDPDREIHEPASALLVNIGLASVPRLVEMTKDHDAGHRARAVRVLGRLGRKARTAVPGLLKLTQDKADDVRREAVGALAVVAPTQKDVAAALLGARQDPDSAVRRQAVRVLGEIGPEAVPVLSAALDDSDEEIAVGAAGALARVGPATALHKALEHPNVLVRRQAVVSLAGFGAGADGVVTALVKASNDRDRQARLMAVAVLDRPDRDIKTAVEALGTALRDKDRRVRRAAIFTVTLLGADARAAVPGLARLLKDQDQEVRRGALRALRTMGQASREVLPAVKEILNAEGHEDLRAEAAETVLRIDPDPVAVFTQALRGLNLELREAAANALVQLGPKAVPALVTLTTDRNLDVRLRAIRCLGTIRADPAAVVPALVRIVEKHIDDARRAAAQALGHFGPDAKPAVPALRGMLRAKDVQDCTGAASALADIGPDAREAIPDLIAALNDRQDGSHDAVIRALARFGTEAKSAAPVLVEKLAGFDTGGPAAKALRAIGPDALPALLAGLKDKEADLRVRVVEVLAPLARKEKSARSALLDALQDKDPKVYWAAVVALSQAGPRVVPPLLELTRDKVPENRWRAAAALGVLGERLREAPIAAIKDRAVPALSELLNDGDQQVRQTAVYSLGKIGTQAEAAVPALVKIANDQTDPSRSRAVEALKSIDPAAAAKVGK